MTEVSLTSGGVFLRDSARMLFESIYGKPRMRVNEQLHRDLHWTPALRFTIHEHINVFVEPSESSPYPRIFDLRDGDVRRFPQPISVYAVCPEDLLDQSGQRAQVKRLESNGFGLITIDSEGNGNRVVNAVPLIQIISTVEMKQQLEGLSAKLKQRVSEAFEDYCIKPVNGVRSLTEIVEGLIEQCRKEVLEQQLASSTKLGRNSADVLDGLHSIGRFQNIRAQIGGVRSYLNEYRNLSHHWPRNKKASYKKYADCRHAFLEGLKQIQRFRFAMKQIGLSGNLPRLTKQ